MYLKINSYPCFIVFWTVEYLFYSTFCAVIFFFCPNSIGSTATVMWQHRQLVCSMKESYRKKTCKHQGGSLEQFLKGAEEQQLWLNKWSTACDRKPCTGFHPLSKHGESFPGILSSCNGSNLPWLYIPAQGSALTLRRLLEKLKSHDICAMAAAGPELQYVDRETTGGAQGLASWWYCCTIQADIVELHVGCIAS